MLGSLRHKAKKKYFIFLTLIWHKSIKCVGLRIEMLQEKWMILIN